jgi:hypothetical protein
MKWEKVKPMKGKVMFGTARRMKDSGIAGLVGKMGTLGMKAIPSKTMKRR